MVIAVMGVLKAGGAYLPLDPGYPLERLGLILEDAGVGVALTERELEGRLPAFLGQIVCMDEEWERIVEEDEGISENAPESGVMAGNLAYVIYTSGSTGRPKGVMLAHRGLCNLVEVERESFGLGEGSRVLQFASLSFDASVWEIFSALVAGGSLHVCRQESLMPGEGLERVLREEEITTVTLPPTVLAVSGGEELVNLETVIAAGEACSAEIVERWARGRRFFDAYGPTEATVCASMGECEAGNKRKPTVGRPIANTRLYILDGELNVAPVGVRGELYIAGIGLARGYLNGPELTADRFIPNLFGGEGGERMYRTGDVCRYERNGEIEFVGRADEQVR
jgi:amino acid adenylation domain-containing protein